MWKNISIFEIFASNNFNNLHAVRRSGFHYYLYFIKIKSTSCKDLFKKFAIFFTDLE